MSDNKDVRLTVVVDGQSPGALPFIEVHNPTHKTVKTVVSSPLHTPVFGGIRGEVDIPSGDSVFVHVENRALRPR